MSNTEADRVNLELQSLAHTIGAVDLRATLHAVAEHRGHPVLPLSEALAEMPDRQRSYDALRRRASFALALPDRWTDLINDVIAFVDPLIHDDTDQLSTWDPELRRWT